MVVGWRRRPGLASVAWCLFGTVLVVIAAHLPVGRGADKIAVDIEAPAGSLVRFYWNDWNGITPQTISVATDRRGVIDFTVPSGELYRIRLDPVARPETRIALYGVLVQLADGATIRIPLEQIAAWNFVNTTKPELIDGALVFTVKGDSFLYSDVQLPAATRLHRLGLYLRRLLRTNEFVFSLIMFAALIAAAAAVSRRAFLPFATLMLVAPATLYFGISVFRRILPPDTFDVGTAVGRAAYLGLSLAPFQWATVLASAVAIVLGVVCARLAFFRERVTGPTDVETFDAPHVACYGWVFAVAWVTLLFFVLMPDLDAVTQQVQTQQFNRFWDSNNYWTWRGLITRGDRPYVDFWYPYMGFWVFMLPLPTGTIMEFLHSLALYAVLGISIWRISGRALVPSLTASVAIVLLCLALVVQSPERYLLSIAFALSYVAMERDGPLLGSGRLWFWLAFALALWAEPAQLLYAAPALAFALFVDEAARGPFAAKRVVVRLITDSVGPFVLVLFLAVFFAVRGEIAGVLENAQDLAAGSIYGTMPTDIDPVFKAYPDSALSVFAPLALLLIGVYFLVRRPDPAAHRPALAVAVCGIVGLLIDQKFFIRGPLHSQMFGPLIVGATFILILLYLSSLSRVAVRLAFGAILGAVAMNPSILWTGYMRVSGAAGRFERTIQTLGETKRMDEANRSAFAASRFSAFPDEMAIIDWMHAHGSKSLYVIGDMPILYLFAPPPPPYQVNLYNSSPVKAQLHVRKWMRRTSPDVIVLDPRTTTFDEVPNIVRVPILASEVTLGYVPQAVIGPYHLLTRRSGQPIPLAFWRQVFGTSVDFGHLLDQSQSRRWPACPEGTTEGTCVRYLALRFVDPVSADTRFELPVEVEGQTFQISFVRRSGTHEYLLPIDRIWFWLAGESSGTRPQAKPRPDVEQAIVSKLPPRPILY